MKCVLDKQTENLKVSCHVSEDNVKLFLDLAFTESPAPKSRPDKDTLVQEVLSAVSEIIKLERVNTAVVTHAVQQLLEDKEVTGRRIAKGSLPNPARDGRIVFLVKKISKTPDFIEDKQGAVDLRSLRLFENIEAQQVVARVYPPRRGDPGVDVFGNVIEGGMGEEVSYTVNETLEVTPPDGKNAYATITSRIEGYLSQEGDALSVQNELLINGDVDYSTGDIDFIGSVTITGSVLPGFTVRAKKDITVQEVLDGGRLISTQGSVTVEKLVSATAPSYIEAAIDVTLSIVQSATVKCGQNLCIRKEARNCKLHSYAGIDMSEAELIGGNTYAICGIDARVLGNESGVRTHISFCSDIEMDAGFRKMLDDIHKHETAITVLKSHLGPYAENPGRVILLKEELKQRMITLIERYVKISQSYKELLAKKEALLKTSKTSAIATASFSGALHPGVEIMAADAVFTAEEKISGPASIVYNEEKREFSVSEYQAVVCTVRGSTEQEEQQHD